jgi:small subunit ribosomal protein S17e
MAEDHGVVGSNQPFSRKGSEVPTRPIEGETMGRVKSVAVKTLGDDLIREHSKKLSADFEKNKKALEDIVDIKSKKVRNVLAGYITNKMKGMKAEEARQTP